MRKAVSSRGRSEILAFLDICDMERIDFCGNSAAGAISARVRRSSLALLRESSRCEHDGCRGGELATLEHRVGSGDQRMALIDVSRSVRHSKTKLSRNASSECADTERRSVRGTQRIGGCDHASEVYGDLVVGMLVRHECVRRDGAVRFHLRRCEATVERIFVCDLFSQSLPRWWPARFRSNGSPAA